jgi:hypothetical protein
LPTRSYFLYPFILKATLLRKYPHRCLRVRNSQFWNVTHRMRRNLDTFCWYWSSLTSDADDVNITSSRRVHTLRKKRDRESIKDSVLIRVSNVGTASFLLVRMLESGVSELFMWIQGINYKWKYRFLNSVPVHWVDKISLE